eukprot:TRINITY_DN8534_c0_g2_i1.p3 TRINITY_DN8534_c0_g2~~TRINITY_DN8534_c0_g2_i1.p3  ORF type:complete len:188 (+),score=29.99 TRINITY_DN8534_c0_g2_i1:1329-1892(+)
MVQRHEMAQRRASLGQYRPITISQASFVPKTEALHGNRQLYLNSNSHLLSAHVLECTLISPLQIISQNIFLVFLMAEEPMEKAILRQVEYYFSDENLPNDFWVLREADAQQWIPLDFIMKGVRMQKLTQDAELVAKTLQLSTLVNCRKIDDVWKIRRKKMLPAALALKARQTLQDSAALSWRKVQPR